MNTYPYDPLTEFAVTGGGANCKRTLAAIHAGKTYFKRDVATVHPQVILLQNCLNESGYDCGNADGKYGSNTIAAVKAFQSDHGLTVDGLFGRASLEMLEAELKNGTHLDSQCCEDDPTYIPRNDGATDKVDDSYDSTKYKSATFTRIDDRDDVETTIRAFSDANPNLMTVREYLANLEAMAADPSTTYKTDDCSGYVKEARNNQGYHGSSTNFARYCKYAGYIPTLGGYAKLIPGMEIYQGVRKTSDGNLYYTSHVGVYAGMYTFDEDEGPVHAVYQSSPGYTSLKTKYDKDNGPNLTAMTDSWNYWAWSKFVRMD